MIMKFNPDIHRRHSIRLKNYDYSQNGYYFVTICTKNRECYFKKYQYLKTIIKNQWENIPNRYHNVTLDEYVIMPNHFHGIVFVGATFTVAQNNDYFNHINWAGVNPAPTIGEIVGSFKSLCVNEWLQYINQNGINEIGKFWQRNYYEHIIRNEIELNKIREYIINNPIKWELDRNNSKRSNQNSATIPKHAINTSQTKKWR